MNTHDTFSKRDASNLDETLLLLAPVVPLAEANGGIRKRDVTGNIDGRIEVLAPWSPLFLPRDELRLYWGDPDTEVDMVLVETQGSNVHLHVPVAHIVAIGDGEVDVWYTRKPALGEPEPQPSPITVILVKTQIPGGDDPDQSTWPVNEGLAKVLLAPGPIEAPIPSEGIEVTVPPWRNMTAGDKLTLFWGGQSLSLPEIDEAAVGQQLIVMVPERIISAAGDSPALAVLYEIRDVVNNWSGRAPPAFIEVDVGAAVYEPPNVLEVIEDTLDFDALGSADAIAIVVENGDMAVGDDVTLIFEGRSLDLWEVSHEETKSLTADGLLNFNLPNAKIGEVVPGDGSVFYRVANGGLQKGRSIRRSFAITGEPVPLPAPVVREAVGNTLDPTNTANGANVDIAPWPGMTAGDLVTLRWEGTTADGDPVVETQTKTLAGGDVGNAVNFLVPYGRVAQIAGGSVEVFYTVKSGASLRESARLSLSILRTEVLPPPRVEAEMGGELDPALVPNGPTLTIPAWPGMAVGDSVQWFWLGESEGGHQTDTIRINAPGDIGDVRAAVARGVIEANANGGDVVNVLYTVTYVDDNSSTSSFKSLRVLPLAELQLPPPIVDEAVGDTLNPDDIDDFATVTVMPYEGMALSDLVWVYFGEGSGGGQHIEDILITQNLIGKPVPMYVPKEKVAFFDTATVTVYYAVHKSNVPWARSEDLVLNVVTPVRWPAPYVEEAIGDDLPEDAYPRWAHTVVPRHTDTQAGDFIEIFWEGGGNRYTDSVTIPTPMDFKFRVLKETIDLWKGQTVQISYRVTRGATVIHSEVLNLRVAVEEILLPAVEMDQLVDGKLNLADIVRFVEFRVLPYEGMRAGDAIFVDWGPGAGNGGATNMIQVSENMVGFPVEDSFERFQVEPFVGQTVAVKYRVESVIGNRNSEVLMVEVVDAAATLDPPRIPAVSNGELDLRQVMGGAEVIVPFASIMLQGDRIVLTWDCTEDAGDFIDSKIVGGGTADISFTVPYGVVAAGVDGTVTVTYELLRGDAGIGTGSAMAFVIKQSELPAVVIIEADGSNLDPDDVPAQGASVEIAETALFALDDVVTLLWKGTTEYETSYTITAADVGNSLLMRVPKAQVVESIGAVVAVYYTILRKITGDTEESPISIYEVYRESSGGDLVVLGVRNGDLDLRASGSGRYLRAVSATTREDLVAEWRYEGEATFESGTSFLDREPGRLLHVRAGDASLSVLPLHLVGSGLNNSSPVGHAAFAARLSSGRPYSWGHPDYGAYIPPNLREIDVEELHLATFAFAALQSNGNVVMWGDPELGGSTSPLPSNVARIAGGHMAFACVKKDGTLLAWGQGLHGGTLTPEASAVHDAKSVFANAWGFCAMRTNGHLLTWGPKDYGGEIPPAYKAHPHLSVRGNSSAFCALRTSGVVVAWGNGTNGGTLSGEVANANNIVEIAASTYGAFAVLTADRKVLAWGRADYGGTVPSNIKQYDDIVEVVGIDYAFCARREGGQIVCWGHRDYGGYFPPQYESEKFVQVTGTAVAFAALRADGTVVTWGVLERGGDSSMVKDKLVDIRAVYANSQAFAAIPAGGGLVTWGFANSGGTLTPEQTNVLNASLRYDVPGSAVSASSPQGRALAAFKKRRMVASAT